MKIFNISMKRSAILSPSEYIKLFNEAPASIKTVRMILPELGRDRHYGKFKVTYNPGYYETCNNAFSE